MTGNSEVENALRSILEDLETKLEPLRTEQAETYWKASVTGEDKAFKAAEQAEREYRFALSDRELFKELGERLADPGVQDLLLRRWARMIQLEMAPHLLDKEVIEDLVGREKKLEALVTSFRPQVAGETVTQNQIKDILRSSDDESLRKEAWEASKQIGPEVAQPLYELIKARNLAARALGFPDYYRMQLDLQEIDEARMFSALGSFTSRSEEVFRRMKAQLDRELADQFRVDAIDLQPWHYGDPFFQRVPPAFGADTDPVYQGRKTLEWVQEYFKGIGLPIDSIVDKGDYLEREGKDPHAFCMHVDRKGDVRTLMNLKDNTYWAEVAMHEFGHAVYELNLDPSLPHTLRQPAHTSTTEGVAQFFGRLVRDIEWMVEMFGLTGPQIRDLERPLQDEQRIHHAVSGRWNLVMIHFERGLYRDPDQDQQQRWWDLVQRFQLLRAPAGRSDAADWATKVHLVTNPVYYQNYMLGEWQASSIHNALVRDLGLESPPLFAEDARIGEWFKEKIFSQGAQWHFHELMRNATGVSPKPNDFVDQFLKG